MFLCKIKQDLLFLDVNFGRKDFAIRGKDSNLSSIRGRNIGVSVNDYKVIPLYPGSNCNLVKRLDKILSYITLCIHGMVAFPVMDVSIRINRGKEIALRGAHNLDRIHLMCSWGFPCGGNIKFLRVQVKFIHFLPPRFFRFLCFRFFL